MALDGVGWRLVSTSRVAVMASSTPLTGHILIGGY